MALNGVAEAQYTKRVGFLLRFLSLRYWLRHRGAFALASLGVALGVAVFVAVQVANYSVLSAFSASLDAVSGKANLQVRGGSSGLPEAVYVQLRQLQDRRIQAVAPVVSRTLVAPELSTTLLVNGIDIFAEAEFRATDWLAATPAVTGGGSVSKSVQPLQLLLDPRAIAVSQTLATRHKLKVGDKLVLNVGSERKTFTIMAVLGDEASGRAFGGDFAVMDIAAAQEALGEEGFLSRVDLLVPEAELEAVKVKIAALLPPDASVGRPAQRAEQVAGLLGAFQLNLTALSSIALFVGAFLIYNAMATAVTRRRSEAGTLRAVGASRSQIMGLFIVEAGFVGLFGSICGLLLGLLLARYTLGAVATTVSELYIAVKARTLFVPPWLWWAAPLGGTLVAMVAAVPAAHEAANTSPRSAMTGATLHLSTERWAPGLAGIGLLLLLLALGLCQPVVSGSNPLVGFGAAGATLAGFAALAPLITLWVGKWVRPLAEKLGGIEGALATDYLRRALNRSSLAIAALMTSLALTMGMNIMVHSFRGTVGEWINNTISADMFIATANGFDGERGPGLPAEVVRWVARHPAVQTYDTLRQASVEINGKPVSILANTLPSLKTGQRKLRFVATRGGRAAAEADFVAGRAILVSERLSNQLGVSVGEELALPSPRGVRRFPIAGVFYDYNPNTVLYLARERYRELWADEGVDGLALYLAPGTTGEAMRDEVEGVFGEKYALALFPNQEIRQAVFDTFDQTFAVTYALQLIALLVAAVGVFDTLVSLLLERSQELAALRAMGASPGQVRKMTLFEFAMLGILAWAMSVAAGMCLAWQMIYVINRQFFGWTIFWDWSPQVIVQSLLLALLAAVGAGLWPARAASRRDIASALQRE